MPPPPPKPPLLLTWRRCHLHWSTCVHGAELGCAPPPPRQNWVSPAPPPNSPGCHLRSSGSVLQKVTLATG